MRCARLLVSCVLWAGPVGATIDPASVVDVGPGTVGSQGVPALSLSGPPALGQPLPDVVLRHGLPLAGAQLIVGPDLHPVSLPAFGAMLWPGPAPSRTLFRLDAAGEGVAAAGTGALPASLTGLTLVLQALVVDPGAEGGLAFSNGLALNVGLGSAAASLFDSPGVLLTTDVQQLVGDVAAADVDGDGWLDFVACGGPGLVLVRGHPEGYPVATQELPSEVGLPTALELADLDGDGLVELLVGGPAGVAVHRQQRPGLLGPAQQPLVTQAAVARVRVADLDQDGHLDLVAGATADGGGLVLSYGVGDGGFTRATFLPLPVSPQDLAVGDLEGDGLLDLLAVGGNGFGAGPDLFVLRGLGGRAFQQPPTTHGFESLVWPGGVAVGDLDRDGRDDVILVSGGGLAPGGKFTVPGRLLAVLSTPAGLSDTAAWDVPSASTVTSALHAGGAPATLADLDLDGRLDLVVHAELSTYLGQGDGSFVPTQAPVRSGLVSLAQAGGDEIPDAVVVGGYGAAQDDVLGMVLVGHGDGTFGEPLPFEPSLKGVAGVLHDLDGDGLLDLVTGGWWFGGAYPLRLFRGTGSGGFAEPEVIAVGGGALDLLVADLTGDGRPDLLTAEDPFSPALRLRTQQADGSFGAPVDLPAGGQPVSVGATDVEGDGDLDLVVLDFLGGAVGVLLREADGFVPGGVSSSGLSLGGQLALADLDGDGFDDVVALEQSQPHGAVLRADGRGGFGPAVPVALPFSPQQLVLADLDGDGRVDLLVAERVQESLQQPAVSRVAVLPGLGDGTFGVAVVHDQPSSVIGLSVADLDRDGSPDVVAGRGGHPAVRLGFGDGGLAPVQCFGGPGAGGAEPLLGDLDGDGDLDVVLVGPSGGSVWINRLE